MNPNVVKYCAFEDLSGTTSKIWVQLKHVGKELFHLLVTAIDIGQVRVLCGINLLHQTLEIVISVLGLDKAELCVKLLSHLRQREFQLVIWIAEVLFV